MTSSVAMVLPVTYNPVCPDPGALLYIDTELATAVGAVPILLNTCTPLRVSLEVDGLY